MNQQFVKAMGDLAYIQHQLPLFGVRLLSMAQEFLRAFTEKSCSTKRIIPAHLDNVEHKGSILEEITELKAKNLEHEKAYSQAVSAQAKLDQHI